MAPLNKQYTFTDGTDIVANQVNVNFDDIVGFINNQLLHRDGTKDFTAVPTGPAVDPTGPNHLSRKAYVDARDDAHRAEVNAAVSAAHGRANQAYDHAQGAHNALPAKLDSDVLRYGYFTGTTNAAGDVVVTHNLGRNPGSIQLTPHSSGGNMPWKVVVENWNSSQINVRMYSSVSGASLPGTGLSFFWVVLG